MSLTKELLFKYKLQNPSKFAHKYGHIDLSKYENMPDDTPIVEAKSRTDIFGNPAQPAVVAPDPSKPLEAPVVLAPSAPIAPAPVVENAVETKAEAEVQADAVVENTETVETETENAPVTTEVVDETTVSGGDANGGTDIK